MVWRQLGCARRLPDRSFMVESRRPRAADRGRGRIAGRRRRHIDRHPGLSGRLVGGAPAPFLRRLRRRGADAARAVDGPVAKAKVTPKLPVSVLVVVHTAQREVLLLARAARPDFWQSVTGSLERAD